jgi:hypothetical protein
MKILDASGKQHATFPADTTWTTTSHPPKLTFTLADRAPGVLMTAKSASSLVTLTYAFRSPTSSIFSELPRGYYASVGHKSTRTLGLNIGWLGVGTYTLSASMHSGRLNQMAVVDASGHIHKRAAPALVWDASYVTGPWNLTFELQEATFGIAFVAATASENVALGYEVVGMDWSS